MTKKRIAIKSAKTFCNENKCKQVIIFAWDGERQHVLTYGNTPENCDQAAQGGDKLKKILGWTGVKKQYPSRLKEIKKKIDLISVAFKDALDVYSEDESGLDSLSYLESLLSIQDIEIGNK